jgi:hypothetical protein
MPRETIPPPPGNEDAGVSMAEAGRRLGIAPETVRRLIELDHLLAWRIMGGRGSRIRVSVASIDDYRARFKVRGRGQPAPVHSLSSSRSSRRHNAAHNEAVRFINSLGTRR